ncbi:MAG TPA: sulfite exporter TauE/SafE family protein [Thermosulfidibacter takaii]|uniref:Probable membrane transporter protein n=1 Tax=Thermosulfidibacter takaii TaxID=412593 RepID=A0A7C0Y5Q5_9BACT|nr:sulfite exporter TauE/SafE family protein [Thermosulfidibacter takaii]
MSLALLAPLIFLVISFVFSMLGMGGSQLYIPILYWLGMNFKHEAIPLGLLLNVATSASAAVTYYRHGLIRVRLAIPFALAMIACAPIGAFINFQVSTKLVILVFALFTLAGSILAYTNWKPQKKVESKKAEIILGITAGSILGLVVGFAGRGGGAMVVPILLMSGLEAKAAAATSSFIVTCAAISGFLGHLPKAHFDPFLTAGTLLAVLIGSQAGSRLMAGKMKPRGVRYVFAGVLFLVAVLLLKDVFK